MQGELVFQDGVALGWRSDRGGLKRPLGKFSVPGTDLSAYVVAPADARMDPLIMAGQMRIELYRGDFNTPIAMEILDPGQPKTIAGLEFTFLRERQFSGFQITKDPGNMLIWIASGLFILGLVLVFYFPHRQVWARAHAEGEGRSRLIVRTTSVRSFAVASSFESLAEQLANELLTRDGSVQGV